MGERVLRGAELGRVGAYGAGGAALGNVPVKRSRRHHFATVYIREDVSLMVSVDEAHETLSGPATQKILQRQSDSSAQHRTVHGSQSKKKTPTTDMTVQPMTADLAAQYEQLRSDVLSYPASRGHGLGPADLISIIRAPHRLTAALGKWPWDYANKLAIVLRLFVLIWYKVETSKLRRAAPEPTKKRPMVLT